MYRKKLRAIVLVTTLLFLVILLMIVGAALILSGSSREASGNLQDNQAALLAAETGLDYARTRLQERPNWQGDGDGIVTKQTVVRSSGNELIVVEDNGTVVGYLKAESGIHSQFRIRFNFHDGNTGQPSDADGLDDPTIFLPGPYVSFNNLDGAGTMDGRRAEFLGSVWRVTSSSPLVDIPAFTAYIVVEGRAGNGLRDQLQDPANPNPMADISGTGASKKVLEANFQRSFSSSTDSVIYANDNIDGTMGSGGIFSVRTANAGEPPRIRSNQSVVIRGDGGPASYATDSTGEVYVSAGPPPGDFTVNGSAGTPGATESNTSKSDFFGLEWDEIRKADPSGPQMRAGTYIWRRDDGTGTPYLEYYQQEYDPANTYAPGTGSLQIRSSNPHDLLLSGSFGTDADLSFATYRTEFKNNIFVAPQGGVKGVAIVPESDVLNIDKSRPLVRFTSGGGQTPVLTSSGQVYVSGEIGGNGSVTAEGNITFQGSSALEVAPDQSVAVYSKGDVILEAIPDPVVSGGGSVVSAVAGALGTGSSSGSGSATGGPGSGVGAVISSAIGGGSGPAPSVQYQDQAFAGIIFAGGDFRADLRSGTSFPGDFFLRGVLSAYGGDPATEAPGESADGLVSVAANNAYFTFDSSYIDNLVDLNAPTPLVRVSYGILE